MEHGSMELLVEHAVNWDADEGGVKAGAAGAQWQVHTF